MSNDRREFLKKGAYAAPTILTLTAMPAFAGWGSRKMDDKKKRVKKRSKKSKKSAKSKKSGKGRKRG